MPKHYECDSCGDQPGGYGRSELEDDGWVWHPLPGKKYFVMCGTCCDLYAKRRKLKEAA